MKKVIYIAVVLSFFIGVNTANAEGVIVLKADTGAEHKIGNKIKLQWSSQDIPSSKRLSIYLQSIEKGFLYPIKENLKLNGSYTWKIPKGTSPATDYQFSMSTQDKGPSVSSENTQKFAIIGNNDDSQSIKTFEPKVSAKKNGTGKVTIKVSRNNGSRLGLNIACSKDKVWVEVKDTEEGCNSWVYFSQKKAQAVINYDNLTGNEEKIYFTLDLYADDGKLLQRQFKDVTILPVTKEISKVNSVYSVTSTDHVRGDKNAKVTVITYTDLECPYCKMFNTTLHELSDYYGNEIAFVYRHFPLTEIHRTALPAARAAECVASIGGDAPFFDFIDAVFDTGIDSSDIYNSLETSAWNVGVNDESGFAQCMDSNDFTKMLSKQRQDAEKIGAQGTPYSIVIGKNGKKQIIVGAQPFSISKNIIDSVR